MSSDEETEPVHGEGEEVQRLPSISEWLKRQQARQTYEEWVCAFARGEATLDDCPLDAWQQAFLSSLQDPDAKFIITSPRRDGGRRFLEQLEEAFYAAQEGNTVYFSASAEKLTRKAYDAFLYGTAGEVEVDPCRRSRSCDVEPPRFSGSEFRRPCNRDRRELS